MSNPSHWYQVSRVNHILVHTCAIGVGVSTLVPFTCIYFGQMIQFLKARDGKYCEYTELVSQLEVIKVIR